MQEVWLVRDGEYRDAEVLMACATQKDALEALKWYLNRTEHPGRCRVEPMQITQPDTLQRKTLHMTELDEKGNIHRTWTGVRWPWDKDLNDLEPKGPDAKGHFMGYSIEDPDEALFSVRRAFNAWEANQPV